MVDETMTETPDPLDIAEELEGFAEGSFSARASLMRDAAAVIRSLVPEPPSEDERLLEREALRRLIAQGSYARFPEDLPYADVADRILASPVWRNRHRGPIADDLNRVALFNPDGSPRSLDEIRSEAARKRAALEASRKVENE